MVLQGRQPYIQHGTLGQAALGTFLYQGLPALCTFLDQGQSALSTRQYFMAVSPRYISVPWAGSPNDKMVSSPRAAGDNTEEEEYE